jgi:hypothetical protein
MKEIIREPAAFCGGMQDKLIQALFHICAAAGQCTISRFRTWKPDIRIRPGRGKDRVFVPFNSVIGETVPVTGNTLLLSPEFHWCRHRSPGSQPS